MTRVEAREAFRRFAVGILGVAAVPFLLLGVAAAGIGFLVWLAYFLIQIFFFGFHSDIDYVGWPFLNFLAWSGLSLVLARWLAKHLPGDGNGGAAAMRYVLIWMAVLWSGFYAGSSLPGAKLFYW